MPSIQVTGQLVDPTTGVEGSADIRIASLINYGQTAKKSISHKSTDASGNYDFQLVYGKHLILVKFDGEQIYNRIGYAVVGDITPDSIDLIQLINLSDENPPSELVTELQQLREDTLNDIVSTSSEVLENAGYKGLWPDTGGLAEKGDTWQTQVGGTPTGNYFTALQNTTDDPVGDNVNWKSNISESYVSSAANQAASQAVSGKIFPQNPNNSLTLGAQSTLVESNSDVLQIDGVDLVYLWEASGSLPAGDYEITNITENTTGGYSIEIAGFGVLEFVTRKTMDRRNSFDARGFGVKASGGKDDSDGWEAFFEWYESNTVAINPTQGTPVYTAPKAVGFKGVSDVSRPIEWPNYFEGDFSKLIFRRHPNWSALATDYLINSSGLYGVNFAGFSIYDEDYAINIENDNSDGGVITVSNFNLHNCDKAMRVECQSSIVSLLNYKFEKCKEALRVVRCDRCILEKGWITQAVLDALYGATIRNENAQLVVRDMIGVPAAHTGGEVAWINNIAGRVDILGGARFGGENSGGCAAVNNFAKFKKIGDPDPTPVGVKIHDSEAYSVDKQGGAQKSCVIRLFELPNYVSFRDNRGLIETQEAITWGNGVAQGDKISELLSTLRGYQYEYSNNCQDGLISEYPDNLVALFAPDNPFALTATASGQGETVSDTRLLPEFSAQYRVVVKGAVNPSSSVAYESTWNGMAELKTGGSPAKTSIETTLLSESVGGPSNNNPLSVSLVFWNGSAESTQINPGDKTQRLRVKVSGWEGGFEGVSFRGYIQRIV